MPRSEGIWDEVERTAGPLWAAWWLDRAPATLQRLVEHYRGLAARTAWQAARSLQMLDRAVDQHDLSQELVIGLQRMVETYDPFTHPGVPFHKYAAGRLTKRIADALRSTDEVGRGARSQGLAPRWVSVETHRHALARQLVAAGASDEHYHNLLLHDVPDPELQRFIRLRWFEQKTCMQTAAAFGKSLSWAFFKQTQALPFLLRAMGREDLIGMPPGRSIQPRHPPRRPT
ncbi:MAG TPA: sigma factor [Tepidisphaeraceae bacterium]|jgi:hypothetical protein|nr:sigma factor [Tepidisphaeraceae bacterium]